MSCREPFETLYILPDGYVTCCQSWLDSRHWHLHADTPAADVWTCGEFSSLRRKVLAGDFSACKTCARRMAGDVPEQVNDLPLRPLHIVLCNDLTCNLHCWHCREHPIRVPNGYVAAETRMRAVLDEYLPTAKTVTLLQSGEVFASPMCLRWLRSLGDSDYGDLEVILTTNGTLLAKRWAHVQPAHRYIRSLSVSIDAATEETYRVVRAPGRWQDLLDGLALAKELRASGRIDRLQVNYCVQVANFREVPAFVDFARPWGADGVKFNVLRRWWQSSDDFAAACVSDPLHPLHSELLAVLKDDRLRDPIVDARLLLC